MPESLGIPVMVRLHITIYPNAMTRLDTLFLSLYWHNKTPCSKQGPVGARAHDLHPNQDAAPSRRLVWHHCSPGQQALYVQLLEMSAGRRQPLLDVVTLFLALFRRIIQHQSCSPNAYSKQLLPISLSCVHFPLCAYFPLYPILYVQKV